jgi:hypothetical protein
MTTQDRQAGLGNGGVYRRNGHGKVLGFAFGVVFDEPGTAQHSSGKEGIFVFSGGARDQRGIYLTDFRLD